MVRSIAVFLLIASLASHASAHGGVYVAPPDSVHGSGPTTGPSSPPTNPSGGSTWRPSATATAQAAAPVARATARCVQRRGDSSRVVAASGGVISTLDPGLDRWEFWWEQNKDRYLSLRERLRAGRFASGGLSQLSGRGRRDTSTSRRPAQDVVDGLVVPALLEILETTHEADLADSIVLALARMASDRTRDAALPVIVAQLGHPALSVQSSAALALGVLGAPEAGDVLAHVAIGDSKGRALVGGGAVPSLVRAFAALSLGVLATPDACTTLTALARGSSDAEADVKVCVLVGLGLLGPDHPRVAEAQACLRELLGDRRLDPVIASYVPTALARLDARDAVPDLVKAFVDRDASLEVRQSVAIALGGLAAPDGQAFELLLDAAEEARDSQTRHFALIALAEVAARAASTETPVELDALLPVLSRVMQGKGRSRDDRTWGALAAAICARSDARFEAPVQERLRAVFAKESDPSARSACAIALGLLGDRGMSDTIGEAFDETRELGFRGYAAVSLGLLRHASSAGTLRQLCAASTTSPSLRLSAATGLGLMGDTGSIETLVEAMREAETLGATAGIARALALVGDTRAIEPLLAAARDGRRGAVARGFACVALGLLCERTDLPFNARIRGDNNYRAQVPAIAEVLDIL